MAASCMHDIAQHNPVLLRETVDNLITSRDGIYIDATFGRGSHSLAILKQLSAKGRVLAFDKDPEAIAFAQQYLTHENRLQIFHASFVRLAEIISQLSLTGKITGILFDLGVSSPQLDNPARGFSFTHNGPLDMRMDNTSGLNAREWLASVKEEDLANVLFQYGEEKFSRRIARAIVAKRQETPITTTGQLTQIIMQAIPVKAKRPGDKHPATRCFQAIRIMINQELQELSAALKQSLEVLQIGGRLTVISFHSLEDRIVKHFIKDNEKGQPLPRGLPLKGVAFQAKLKTLTKPIKPSLKEMHLNPRSRSAILRIAEKIS